MMKKRKTRLEVQQEKVQQAIDVTNKKIDELGFYDKWIYDELNEMQELFDQIRNVPSEERFNYEEQIKIKDHWKTQVEEIEKEYNTAVAKNAGKGAAGAGVGVAMAALGPTAAMGVATTFGVASTGVAISSLNGIAATNAALAWLGGGTLAAGGGGVAAGEAFLAMAGPIGWAIAGLSLLASGLFIWKNSNDNKRLSDIFILIGKRDVESYKLSIVELEERFKELRKQISILDRAIEEIKTFGTDYDLMREEQQYKLGSYVNDLKRANRLLTEPIKGLYPKYEEKDYRDYLENHYDLSSDYLDLLFEIRKNTVVCLANLLYKIELNEEDRKLLCKTLRRNDDFLKSVKIDKKQMSNQKMEEVYRALQYKYEILSKQKKIKGIKVKVVNK